MQCSLFYTEFDGEFNGASCQIFSLVQKKLSKNVDVDILCKIKFFMDNVLSVEVLKLAITTINCVECLHEARGKTNICIGKYFWHTVTSPLKL